MSDFEDFTPAEELYFDALEDGADRTTLSVDDFETVATLMSDGAEVVGVNVTHDLDADALQIAASAYASITGVQVGDREFTLREIREFWA